jgi:hypothetical protein
MRLPGTEDWSSRDIEAQIAFEEGFADDAAELLRDFYEANFGEQTSAARIVPPMEGLYARGKAAELAFAVDDVGLGTAICLDVVAKEYPSTPMQGAYFAALGAVTKTITVRPSPSGAVIIGQNRLQKGLIVSWPQDDSDFAATLMRLFLPPAAATGTLAENIEEPFLLDWGEVKPQTMGKLFASHEFKALVGGGSVPQRYERAAAVLAMEAQYSARLSIMRADHYHWNQMQPRGPLIDWPLLCTWVALLRFTKAVEEIPIPNKEAAFIRWLATEIATGLSRPAPRRRE